MKVAWVITFLTRLISESSEHHRETNLSCEISYNVHSWYHHVVEIAGLRPCRQEGRPTVWCIICRESSEQSRAEPFRAVQSRAGRSRAGWWITHAKETIQWVWVCPESFECRLNSFPVEFSMLMNILRKFSIFREDQNVLGSQLSEISQRMFLNFQKVVFR